MFTAFGLSVLLATAGGIIAALSAAVGIVLPNLARETLLSDLEGYAAITSPDAEGYAVWQSTLADTAPPVYYDIYGFDLKNAEDVLTKGAKPIVEETAPARWNLQEVRENLNYSSDLEEVSFRMWEFVQGCDSGPCKQNYTTINIVFFLLQHQLGVPFDDLVYDAFYGKDELKMLTMNRSVEEIAFGYVDPVLLFLKDFAKIFKKNIPDKFPGAIGNTSYEELESSVGWSTQKTGKGNWNDARMYTKWNGLETVKCCAQGPCGPNDTLPNGTIPGSIDMWGTAEANKVKGTWGQQYAPGGRLGPDANGVGKPLSTWVENLFREATLENVNGETRRWRDILAHRYRIPQSLVVNSTENIEAFYMNTTGLFDISRCAAQLPAFLSKPHFLDADPALREAVVGMHPNRAKHDTVLDVELNSGVVVVTEERLQFNVLIEPVGSAFPNLKPVYMPILWVDKHYTITHSQAKSLSQGLNKAATVANVAILIGYAGGAFGGLLFLCFAFRAYSKAAPDRYACFATKSDEQLYDEGYSPMHDQTDPEMSDAMLRTDADSFTSAPSSHGGLN